MKSELTIGKVLKPRGLKGEVKFEIYSSNSARFSHLKKVKLDGIEYSIKKLSLENDLGYIQFDGVDTFDDAEALRGKFISANRNDLPQPEKGKYYIVDMIGLDVFVGGDLIGELVDIQQYGSADVYIVKTQDGTISFPALKEVVQKVDIEGGNIVLDDRIFPRVAVFN